MRRFERTQAGHWHEVGDCVRYQEAPGALLDFFSDSPVAAQGEGELTGAA